MNNNLHVTKHIIIAVSEICHGINILKRLCTIHTELIGIGVPFVLCIINNILHIVIELMIILLLLMIQITDHFVCTGLRHMIFIAVISNINIDNTTFTEIPAIRSALDMTKTLLLQGIWSFRIIHTTNHCNDIFPGLLPDPRDALIVVIITIPIQQQFIFTNTDDLRIGSGGNHHTVHIVHREDTVFQNLCRQQINRVDIFPIAIVTILIKVGRLLNHGILWYHIPDFKAIDIVIIISSCKSFGMLFQFDSLPCMEASVLFIIPNQDIIIVVLNELSNNLILLIRFIQHAGETTQHVFKSSWNKGLLRIFDRNHLRQLIAHHDHTRRIDVSLLGHQRRWTKTIGWIFQFIDSF